mmetsp:Transcript_10417/g.27073  ORF Transcript_10417/g.27073 Transcript_10417/m.27073 type:complete len:201 (-) Transcript_10417:262-864(-)
MRFIDPACLEPTIWSDWITFDCFARSCEMASDAATMAAFSRSASSPAIASLSSRSIASICSSVSVISSSKRSFPSCPTAKCAANPGSRGGTVIAPPPLCAMSSSSISTLRKISPASALRVLVSRSRLRMPASCSATDCCNVVFSSRSCSMVRTDCPMRMRWRIASLRSFLLRLSACSSASSVLWPPPSATLACVFCSCAS